MKLLRIKVVEFEKSNEYEVCDDESKNEFEMKCEEEEEEDDSGDSLNSNVKYGKISLNSLKLSNNECNDTSYIPFKRKTRLDKKRMIVSPPPVINSDNSMKSKHICFKNNL